MGDLTKNFSRHEFACKCGCGRDTIDAETLSILEAVRTFYGRPVAITSGNRCEQYNKRVGGAINSQHIRGRAADFTVRGVSTREVADWLKKNYKNASIGIYPSFVHVDTRTDGPAYWLG